MARRVLFPAAVLLGAVLASPHAVAQCLELVFRSGFETVDPAPWPVAVEVSELGNDDPGRSVSLTLNDADPLVITADGTFCFDDVTPGGEAYRIEITGQPSQGDACALDNATGIATAPVVVEATCNLERSLWDQMRWDQDPWN